MNTSAFLSPVAISATRLRPRLCHSMSLNPRMTDLDRLRHMRDAACAALRFVQGAAGAGLDNDEMLAFAVVRALEIFGEA